MDRKGPRRRTWRWCWPLLLLAACEPNPGSQTRSAASALEAQRSGHTGACPDGFRYARVPDWTSAPLPNATGLGLADINGDGYQDLVLSGGNDESLQPIVVYENDGHGGFPATPSWTSGDVHFNENLAIGDIDGDGWLDVAVTTFAGDGGEFFQGQAVVYFNRGGRLESLPSYHSADRFIGFGAALGDVDADGDLDLAVGVLSDDDNEVRCSARIFYNEHGRLSERSGWTCSDQASGLDLDFADLDADGFLDLAVATPEPRIYGGGLAGAAGGGVDIRRMPSWVGHSPGGTAPLLAPFLDVGVIGPAGELGLVVSFNPLCPPGAASCMPAWAAAYVPGRSVDPIWSLPGSDRGGGLLLADLNRDRRLDLIAGRWGTVGTEGAPFQIHRGSGDAFDAMPALVSETRPVAEAIAVADLRHAALHRAKEVFIVRRPQAVVTLSRRVIERLDGIERNGRPLAAGQYAHVPGGNWISFAERLRPGERLRVRYTYSDRLDIAVANFGAPGGATIFYQRRNKIDP